MAQEEAQEFNEEQHNQEMTNKVEEIEQAVNPTEDTSTDSTEEETTETSEESTEEETSTTESEEETTEEDQDADEEIDEVLDEAGLKMEDLQTEFDEDGQLSPESYLALERAGIPKDTVDNYIAGMEAQSQIIEMQAYEAAGGKENYQAITQWASDNLTEDEISAFNETLGQPNSAQFNLALSGLQARYEASNGSTTDNLNGGGRATSDVFESTDQVRAAMSDPRYKTDVSYQKQVQNKLMRSNVL